MRKKNKSSQQKEKKKLHQIKKKKVYDWGFVLKLIKGNPKLYTLL